MGEGGEAARGTDDGSGLPRVEDMSRAERFRKRTLAGNLIAALYRSRRAAPRALAAARAARHDRSAALPLSDPRRSFRAVYLIPAGPGDWAPLADTIDSVLHHEGDDVKVIVVDDASVDCREARVRSTFPQVDVLRRRWPSGGPPRDFPGVAEGIELALERYEFDALLKLDTDALVTAPSPAAATADYFAERPEVGMLGTYLVRADGLPENYDFDRWTLPHTVRWSRGVRRLLARARACGYDGARVRGGVYAISRAALDRAARSGDLRWRPPWWTQLSEDFWLSLIVLANGFEFASAGGPGEQFVVASNFVPLEKERVLTEGKLAIHSVRRGRDGEDEAELRRFFAAARGGASQAAVESRATGTDSSLPPSR
jgi:hypothetical protein